MTPRETVIAQIDHQETHPVPYTIGFEGGTDQQLDEHYGSPDWRERIVQYMTSVGWVDTQLQQYVEGDPIAYDAYGTAWRMDLRPFHLETPGLTEPSFDNWQFPPIEDFLAKAAEGTANAEETIAENPDTYHLIYMGWGLFESSWGIRGFENVLMDIVAEEDFFGELLDKLTELFLALVGHCKDVPGDAIMFGDDWGIQRGVTVGPDRWRKFFKPRWAKIYDATHAQGKKVITHCCGSIADIMGDVVEIGLDVLESVQPEAYGMNPYELKKQWGDKLAFWGCLGSQSTLQFGTPDDIRNEVRKLRREMSKGGGFILAPAKDLQPGTPIENAVAAVEAFTEQQ